MAKPKRSVTPAVRVLRAHGVDFELHPYPYEHRGGTARTSEILDIDEHQVIKTLVMTGGRKLYFIVLMHGDRQVSTKALARSLDLKAVAPCETEVARRITGYQTGGISPLGTREALRIYIEASIMTLERIYINGGRRGLMVCLRPADLADILNPIEVHVAI